jgi:hypothetical protein
MFIVGDELLLPIQEIMLFINTVFIQTSLKKIEKFLLKRL